MRIRLEDEKGFPWTASASLGWLTIITVLTVGIAPLLLGLYLALWIRSKGRSALPLFGFAFAISSVLVLDILDHFSRFSALSGILSGLFGISWIVATFLLRHEIQHYYKEREGWNIEIGSDLHFFVLFSLHQLLPEPLHSV